jgi:hypothetical protein
MCNSVPEILGSVIAMPALVAGAGDLLLGVCSEKLRHTENGPGASCSERLLISSCQLDDKRLAAKYSFARSRHLGSSSDGVLEDSEEGCQPGVEMSLRPANARPNESMYVSLGRSSFSQ